MACARVPLDEQQVTEPGPLGNERTLPALVSHSLLCMQIFLYAPNNSLYGSRNNLSHRRFIVIKHFDLCSTSAPWEEGGALLCALQVPTRRWISCWGGGVFRTCQIHHRGPGVAACTAPWPVLVSGKGLSKCEQDTFSFQLATVYWSWQNGKSSVDPVTRSPQEMALVVTWNQLLLHEVRAFFNFFIFYLSLPCHGLHQVVFDESLQRCLDSYLHLAPRGLDLAALPTSPAVADMQRSVHRAVFLTFLRMATHKESKVENLCFNREIMTWCTSCVMSQLSLQW